MVLEEVLQRATNLLEITSGDLSNKYSQVISISEEIFRWYASLPLKIKALSAGTGIFTTIILFTLGFGYKEQDKSTFETLDYKLYLSSGQYMPIDGRDSTILVFKDSELMDIKGLAGYRDEEVVFIGENNFIVLCNYARDLCLAKITENYGLEVANIPGFSRGAGNISDFVVTKDFTLIYAKNNNSLEISRLCYFDILSGILLNCTENQFTITELGYADDTLVFVRSSANDKGNEKRMVFVDTNTGETMEYEKPGGTYYSLGIVDDTFVIYVADSNIYIYDREGRTSRQILKGNGKMISNLSLSPSGDLLAYIREGDIYVVDINYSLETKLPELSEETTTSYFFWTDADSLLSTASNGPYDFALYAADVKGNLRILEQFTLTDYQMRWLEPLEKEDMSNN